MDLLSYKELFEEAKTLALLGLRGATAVPSWMMNFKEDFPIYAGEDFIAINYFDMGKATELGTCHGFTIGLFLFLPTINGEVVRRLRILQETIRTYNGPIPSSRPVAVEEGEAVKCREMDKVFADRSSGRSRKH